MSKELSFRISALSGVISLVLQMGVVVVAGLFEFFQPLQIFIVIFLISALCMVGVRLSIYLFTVNKSEFNERAILDNSLTGIFIATPGLGMGEVAYVNQAFADMLGTSPEALVSDEFLPQRFWSSASQREEFLEIIRKEKMITSIELKFRNAGDKEWWGRLSSRHLDTPTGVRIQGTIIDITEKKKFEEVLTNYNDTLEKEISERTRERDELQKVSILGLSKITEYRDPETGNHVIRMAHYSRLIAKGLGQSPKYRHYITDTYVDEIFISAPLHDIGKVGIEDRVLKKPGKLTPDEFELMKYHSIYGGDTLRDIEKQLSFRSFLTLGKEIAYNHHQKWDGSGYPNYPAEGGHPTLNIQGHRPLKGSEVPLSARIVALADVYDALTSKRCYKNAIPHDKARSIILEERGAHFDPDIVDIFMELEQEFIAILAKFKD
ncbi:MAG: HD domain-containing phosphohydrolase [Fibrobacterota bacterium]